jgi:hypothetical protein
MTLGLFVVKPTYKRAAYLEGTILDASTGLPIPNASIEIISNSKIKFSGLDGTFKTGTVDTGMLNVSIDADGYRTVSTKLNFTAGVVNNQTINLYPNGTGVNDFNTNSQWKVYPTTFDASINIQLKEKENGNFSITDVSGCQVFQAQSNGAAAQQLDLSNLAAGMYVIKYTNQSNQTFQQKIFKK